MVPEFVHWGQHPGWTSWHSSVSQPEQPIPGTPACPAHSTPHYTLLLPHLGLLLEKSSRMCRGRGVRSNPTGLQWSRPLASVCLKFLYLFWVFYELGKLFSSLFSFFNHFSNSAFKCCSSSTWKAQEQEKVSISLRCCSCSC